MAHTITLERLSKNVWMALVPLCLLCVSFYLAYQKEIFPTIATPITFSQQQAQTQALGANKSLKLKLNPQQVQTASAYVTNSQIQNYITLEAGGNEKLNQLLTQKKLISSFWSVRLYIPKETQENYYFFTPSGEFYGFSFNIPEDKKLPNISKSKARKKITSFVDKHPIAQIDFSAYTIKDYDSQEQNNGRIDHTFTFENKKAAIGEAIPELTFTISGNRLTTVKPGYKLPENFIKDYQQMYSYNMALGTVGNIMLLGYLAIAVYSIVYGWKRGLLDWHGATLMAAFITATQALSSLNILPTLWYYLYEPSRNPSQFLWEHIIPILPSSAITFTYLTLTMLAAEFLTRQAFPHHPQIWHWLSRKQTASNTLVKQIGMGYAMFCLDLGYIALFYLTALQIPGVWSPSFNLFDPNFIANYVPFFSSFSLSLHAGVWEEFLFRAIPIASAAIIGRKYNRPHLFIGIALVLQAVVFGIAHASYPQQPFFIRAIELSIPFFFWGLAYIHFGLLPCIVSHYAYDLFVTSESLFFMDTPHIWIQQIGAAICLGLPALILLGLRVYQQSFWSWKPLPDSERNEKWQNPTRSSKETPYLIQKTQLLSRPALLILTAVALLGLGTIISSTQKIVPATTQLTLSKTQALEEAKKTAASILDLDKDWEISIIAENRGGTTSPEYLQYLLGSENSNAILQKRSIETTQGTEYLDAFLPRSVWHVRYANFTGDQDARSEQLDIYLRCPGKPATFEYTLSENTPGKNIEEAEAVTLAQKSLETHTLNRKQTTPWKVIKSSSQTQPSGRVDWHITLQYPDTQILKEVTPRWYVAINGNQVTFMGGTIFIPEKWQENLSERQGIIQILSTLTGFGSIVGFLIVLYQALHLISLGKVNNSVLQKVYLCVLALSLLQAFNIIPSFYATLSTASPIFNQLSSIYGALLASSVVRSAIKTLCIVYVISRQSDYVKVSSALETFLTGLLLGAIFYCVPVIASQYGTTNALFGDLAALNSVSTLYAFLYDAWSSFAFQTFFCMALCLWCQKNVDCITSLCLLAYCVIGYFMGEQLITTPHEFFSMGTLFLGVSIVSYLTVIQYNLACIPALVASYLTLSSLQQMVFQPYPGYIVYQLVTIAFLLVISYGFIVLLIQHQKPEK